ncbi:CcmD family protein [Reichenbachiella agariperforans]|uniref:CcmD family protein n=1 Tax=Reichenbachiella agariperforans TaxID=156994 RepID=UPI001C0962FD|nr:CcmD family protein [Reichenbachiella agariperforans]MBU2916064.1 CcmD family protein [Reichenbachiella agariperforans]
MKKLLFVLLFTLSLQATAQDEKYQVTEGDYTNQRVEMADTMRQSGKIYVVVAVVMTIFAGMVIYLVRLDKKVTKLEDELTEAKQD